MVIIIKWSWRWQVVKGQRVVAACCVFQGKEELNKEELALAVQAKHPDYANSFIASAKPASMEGNEE